MSSSKRGGGADSIYRSHIFGDFNGYQPNNSVKREQSIMMNHVRTLSELALNRFEWTGFPESVDTRFLELTLYHTALSIVYWDEDFDQLFAVRGSGSGFVNMLDNPVSFMVVGPSELNSTIQDGMGKVMGIRNKSAIRAYEPGVHKDVSERDAKKLCVPIWANAFRHPDIELIHIYATRLAWLDRTIEINTKNARRTKVLKTSQNVSLSAVNANRSLDQGDEIIQLTGPLNDMDWLEAIDLSVDPDSYKELHILRTRIWNECVGLFGINGANQDKKERLVAAEVGANDEQIASMRYSALNARQDAAKKISKLFGIDVKVNFRTINEQKEEMQEAASLQQPMQSSNAENPEGEDK